MSKCYVGTECGWEVSSHAAGQAGHRRTSAWKLTTYAHCAWRTPPGWAQTTHLVEAASANDRLELGVRDGAADHREARLLDVLAEHVMDVVQVGVRTRLSLSC